MLFVVHSRRKVLEELLETEEAYLMNLSLLAAFFEEPLAQQSASLGLTPDKASTLVQNLPQLRSVSLSLLEPLRVAVPLYSSSKAAQAFLDAAPNLPAFSEYISRFLFLLRVR